ncbi:MAG TPA: hypothetical protein PLT03_01630, partial [Bacillota bacterium]|nr:hypothetical protein [Bacillota bacterium]
RLNKYNLFTASFVAALIYVIMAWFMDEGLIMEIVPLVLLMDSTLMTSLLVGATLFYEKKEHTINSIMVTPSTSDEYLIAKVAANVAVSLFTVLLMGLALYLLKGVTFSYVHVVIATVAITVLHTLIGVRIAYTAKNFTSMLVSFMVYALVFFMPSVLVMVDVIGPRYADFVVLSPLESCANLLSAGFVDTVPPWKLAFGYSYVAVLSAALYRFAVKPRFAEYMMREMGV